MYAQQATRTITRRNIKQTERTLRGLRGLRALGQGCVDEVGNPVDCSYWASNTDLSTDGGSTSFWDNVFDLIKVGSTAAVNIIKADNQYYYTPQGRYPYGTGQYGAITPSQAALYLQQRPGGVTGGGFGTMDWQTIAMVGMGLMLFMTMMRR